MSLKATLKRSGAFMGSPYDYVGGMKRYPNFPCCVFTIPLAVSKEGRKAPVTYLLTYPLARNFCAARARPPRSAAAQPDHRPRMMRRVCFLALCVAARATPSGAQLDGLGAPLLTIPLHKGGEEYALLDFFSADPAHIETTAHQFCSDHSFSAADKAMIIEHATKQMAMVQSQRAQLPQVNGVSGQGPVPPNKPTSNVHKLVMFMTENKMSPADVLRALADTL